MNFIPDESANKAGIFRFKTVLFNIDFRYNCSNHDKKNPEGNSEKLRRDGNCRLVVISE